MSVKQHHILHKVSLVPHLIARKSEWGIKKGWGGGCLLVLHIIELSVQPNSKKDLNFKGTECTYANASFYYDKINHLHKCMQNCSLVDNTYYLF